MLRKISVAAVALLATAAPAAAQEATIGSRLTALLASSWGPVFVLIGVVSFVLGLFFLAKGLIKLRDAAQPGGRGTVGEGVAWIFAAAMLISLPDAAGVGLMTVFGDNGTTAGLAAFEGQVDSAGANTVADSSQGMTSALVRGMVSPPSPTNCLSGNDAPATCMAKNLATNAVPMGIVALFAITFLIGLLTFAGAVVDVAKSQSNGQGRLERGWGVKLLVAILLMNAPYFFLVMTRTLLGLGDATLGVDGLQSSSALLTYKPAGGDSRFAKFAELIQWSFVILVFFGAWAFVRGIFMAKSVAEGKGQQGTYAMAAVYMVAGVLLANAKFSACMLLYTVTGSDGQMGFCN